MPERITTIQNGTLISVVDFSRKKADIQIVDGVITQIAESIAVADGEVIDATGMLISTGWVDVHTHFYQHDNSLGITQECLLQNGITYAVDAGSCGVDNIDDFLSQLGGDLDTKVFINLANDGIGDGVRAIELKSMDNIDEETLVAKCLAHKGQIIGIKIRIDHRFCVDSEGALQSARRVCDKTGLPLMIHASRTVIPYEVILKYFQKGDIIAHCYSSQTPCIIDEAGNIKPCIVQAKKDGIIFDMSHGATNFSFDVAKAAIAQGIEVDSISTDLHQRNINGPVHSMALTLSKMMGLGYTLEEVLNLMTVEACKTLGITDKKFEIAVGDKADLTAFVCKEETADLTDSFGVAHTCGHRVRTQFTVKNQNIYQTE